MTKTTTTMTTTTMTDDESCRRLKPAPRPHRPELTIKAKPRLGLSEPRPDGGSQGEKPASDRKSLRSREGDRSKFGPGSDFEKKMEQLGEKIGKEMEAKFGPALSSRRRWKAFGKEMEAKFGPGSEFEKKMEAFGKEMEAKFGPGSDFEKKMKGLGEEMESEVRPRVRLRQEARRARHPVGF